MNDYLVTYIDKYIFKTIECEEIIQQFQKIKNRWELLSELKYVWKNKLKFTFYVRLCMRISLAYSWLFTLLLILINFFKIKFLLSILSFILPPNPNFWLRHCQDLGVIRRE